VIRFAAMTLGTYFMIAFFVALVCGAIGANIGSDSGNEGQGFAWGFLLGPLGLIIIAVISSSDTQGRGRQQVASGTKKQCPACMEFIHVEASVCPHCRRDIPKPAPAAVAPPPPVSSQLWDSLLPPPPPSSHLWDILLPESSWVYVMGAEVLGPFRPSRLPALVEAGTVTLDAMCKPDEKAWKPLREVVRRR
jgi:hypothetical protein